MNRRTHLTHIPGAAGVDEAGRGPLAGPVVAAAVILPMEFDCEGVDDSKKLDAAHREDLAKRILATATYAIELAHHDEIDRKNILHASLAAMARAIERIPATKVYVDGNRLPPGLMCEAEAVVKGDGIYACIAAASILAKTTRDRLMIKFALQYPGYGFERHFGYPTPEHFIALRRLGPCPIHRRSFAPVREAERDSPEQLCLIP
jgi:ribonuclease HII